MTNFTVAYRIGDTRLLAPFKLRALSLWAMLKFWPDEHDQNVLRRYQYQLHRDGEPQQPRVTKKQRVLSADARLDSALQYLTHRHLMDNQYRVRHMFAAECHKEARHRKVTRPFDMCAAFSGLVKKNFLVVTPEDAMLYGTEPVPLALHTYVGTYEIDNLVTAGGQIVARALAREIITAILAAYPEDSVCN